MILTAQLTDPALYHGRLLEMLRGEVRHTTVQKAIPANLPFATRHAAAASFFGAGEYAKDGLVGVTEYLGRTPWFYRMVDMIDDAMTDGPVRSGFGVLPADDAELNGDYLQVLVRLATMTGDARFLGWARRIANLPKYRSYSWEPRPGLPLGSFDGYADSIESAIYLYNREPAPDAGRWIDWEMEVMLGMQRADGHVEDWYGEGNFNRTALLYAYMKSQGVRPARWEPGVGVGAVTERRVLHLHLVAPAARRVQFDFARHRRVLNLAQNYVRLNEFPEWFVVDEKTLYRLQSTAGGPSLVRLGSELIEGVELAPGDWSVESLGPPPYAGRPLP